MAITASKPIPLRPAAGFLDLRSEAADISMGHRRIVLNKQVREQGREARAGGLTRLFGSSEHGFLNQDLHDKDLDSPEEDCLFGTAADGCDEAITFLFPSETSSGSRKLIAGGNKRLYELAERSGVWRVIGDGFGNPTVNPDRDDCEPCVGYRFRADQLLGYVVATNNYNTPIAYRPGFTTDGGCDTGTVADLESLGVTRVGVVKQFRGFMFYGDVTMDGQQYPGLVLHSDFNAPLDVVPLPGTNLARSFTLGFSERVLAFEPLGDYLIAYTDKGIWRVVMEIAYAPDTNIPAQVFKSYRIYIGPHSLRYKHAIVNTGNEHVFAGVDGVYVLRSAVSAPERVEWVHRATGAIYNGLNKWSRELQDLPEGVDLNYGPLNESACENFIGWYNPLASEVWFSWPTDDNVCANLSLRMNIRPGYEHASLVDEGFSAAVYFRPDDRPTYAEWLWQVARCEMATETQLPSYALNTPPYIWNAEENPLGVIAPDSLCAILGNTTLDDICARCELAPVFIVASTRDHSLKELNDEAFYREFWNSGAGVYEEEGYADFVQTIIGNIGSDVDKAFGGSETPGLVAEFKAEAQTTPGVLRAQAGFGVSAACPTWRTLNTRELKCLDSEAKFAFFFRGRYLSFRMWSNGTGQPHAISRVDAHVRNLQSRG